MTDYRWWRWGCGALLLVFVLAPLAGAQTQGAVAPSNWKELVAVLINTAGVMLVVQGIKLAMPYLTDKFGWVMPIVAMIAGPFVAMLQGYLATLLGYPGFDFSLIVAALTGGTAVAANQIYKQQQEGPTGPALRRPGG
jgi:hypothetical protein